MMKMEVKKNIKTIWYFPLETVNSRYTEQLCKYWIPNNIKKFLNKGDRFKIINGVKIDKEISVGIVFDATGRGIYSLGQISKFLYHIRKGDVKNNDILFFQDFWTPGIEAIQYALDLYNIKVKVYSRCWAQSVDKYDFTYMMKKWIRNIELGYDNFHKDGGIFVGSSIHKRQLRSAGFKSPIHVLSLPVDNTEVKQRIKHFQKNTECAIIFSSRLDKEKNPLFMLEIAKQFLKKYPNWKFYVTTSGKEIRSNMDGIINKIRDFSKENPRFIIKEGLTKNEYYKLLCKCKIQLNTSFQDYVAFTAIEASICECDLCYPNFRSFPEFIPKDRMYNPWDIKDVLNVIDDCIKNPQQHIWILELTKYALLKECEIIVNDSLKEIVVWKNKSKFIK
jgi:glycosyltransferase involved in cell wall biosynthesis